MNKPRAWIDVDGRVNTLRGHLIDRGMTTGWASKLATKHKCSVSKIPVKALESLFSARVKRVQQPRNWQEIMYGSSRGAQKNVPKGKRRFGHKGVCEVKESKMANSELIDRFVTMRLTENPGPCHFYY